MRRRDFIAGLGSAASWPVVARAQQRTMPVMGYLTNLGSQSADDYYVVAFLQGLKETGYVEGQNVAIEYRWAEDQADRLPMLAADLVRRRVAVIFAGSTPGTRLFRLPNLSSQPCKRRHARWACNSLFRMPEPIAISNRPSQLFCNSMLVRS
jgi:hypothetical protein